MSIKSLVSNKNYLFFLFTSILWVFFCTTTGFADVTQAVETTTGTAINILLGPVCKFCSVVIVVWLITRLIQQDMKAVFYLLAAAIVLFNAKTIVDFFTGK